MTRENKRFIEILLFYRQVSLRDVTPFYSTKIT